VPASGKIIVKYQYTTMGNSEVHNRIADMLREFDTLEEIHPSARWNQSLHDKLSVSKSGYRVRKPNQLLVAMIIIVIMLNAGFILKTMTAESGRPAHRSIDLQVISNELLFNPVSENN
jgi:hypothetical protein